MKRWNLVVVVVVLVGCAGAKKLPPIDASKVTTLTPVVTHAPGRPPGVCVYDEHDPTRGGFGAVTVRATMADGKVRDTSHKAGDARFDIHEIEMTASSGKIKYGTDYYQLEAAPVEELLEKDVELTFHFKNNPKAAGSITVKPDFGCPVILSAGSGGMGAGGDGGQPGQDGGAGQDGGHGYEGAEGGVGPPGPDLDVTLRPRETKRGMLVEVTTTRSDGKPVPTLLVSPDARITVTSVGGRGGTGGLGGPGGAGGPGGRNTERFGDGTCGDLLRGGDGGPGGRGGQGGPGGRIVVHYDGAHAEYKDIVIAQSLGGSGGGAGSGGGKGSWGTVNPNWSCSVAETNYEGKLGRNGSDGGAGENGPAAQYITIGSQPRNDTRPTVGSRPGGRPGAPVPGTPTPTTRPGSMPAPTGKLLKGTFSMSANGAAPQKGAVEVTVTSTSPPAFMIKDLACPITTEPYGGSFKVVPTSCKEGADDLFVQQGTVTKKGAGYKITLALRRTGKVNGRKASIDIMFVIEAK